MRRGNRVGKRRAVLALAAVTSAFACGEPAPDVVTRRLHDDLSVARASGSPRPHARRPPRGFSQTPTQVRGIDESDLVKTEGDRIFLIDARTLHVLHAWPAPEMDIVASLPIEGEAASLIVHDGKLVVVSIVVAPIEGMRDVAPPQVSSPTLSKITVVDASDDALRVTREIYIDGGAGAQIQGEWARIIVSQEASSAEAAGADASHLFVERIDGRVVWVPHEAPERVAAPSDFSLPIITRVVTLDLAHLDAPLETTALLGTRGDAYLDSQALVLLQSDYVPSEISAVKPITNLHWFDAQTAQLRRVASGSAPGNVISGTDISRSGDVLRVVLNEPIFVPLPDNAGLELTGSDGRLLTLGINDGALVELGRVESPAGELYATRFVGEHAYCIVGSSAEQPTQFASIDLTNPAAPEFVGHTDLPGFSQQLVPLRRQRMLGIGQAIDATGVLANQALHLFDTSDLAAPRLLDQYQYVEPVWTDASFMLHPIAIHPNGNWVALPAYDTDATDGSLDLFQITPDARWARTARLIPTLPPRSLPECLRVMGYADDAEGLAKAEQTPHLLALIEERCPLYNQTRMLRGIFREDVVYAISTHTVGAYSLDSTTPLLRQVVLP